MGTLTIRLEIDPLTKKKNVWVKLDSDSDALPMEHEEQHRTIVQALLSHGGLKAEDMGTITIEREGQGPTVAEGPKEDERQGQKAGHPGSSS